MARSAKEWQAPVSFALSGALFFVNNSVNDRDLVIGAHKIGKIFDVVRMTRRTR